MPQHTGFANKEQAREAFDARFKKWIADGYKRIDDDKCVDISVAWLLTGPIDAALDVRHKFEDLMDTELRSKGLGHCSGGAVDGGHCRVECGIVPIPLAITLAKQIASEVAGKLGVDIHA
jgi:hypothetical protein